MKNYKKGLLALSIVSVIPFVMANTVEDERIKVTTFVDEDGENLEACSLREAITAAMQNKPYGGCAKGKLHPSVTDTILLEKGEYLLSKSLTPGSQINIYGGEINDWSQKDAVTGTYPALLQPTTTIKGNGTFSLFDTSSGKATLILNNLGLHNGGGKRGGAILAGGAITLNQVEIKNSSASEVGGAIYLSGVGSFLQVEDSLFENNQAPKGAVIAMSCIDNLTFTKREIGFQRSSILNNGNNSTSQIIEFCGNPSVEFFNNTITLNKANTNQGSIIKFTGDSAPNTNQPAILSSLSSIKLQNNTVINNTANATFLYDSIGVKSLFYNILAYNKGHSCRHLLGKFKDTLSVNIGFGYNGLNKLATAEDYCYLPFPEKNDTSIDLSKVQQSSILLPLQSANKFSAFKPMYFLNPIAKNPLVNVALGLSCAENDQRKKSRVSLSELLLEKNNDTCDIGAIEQTHLRAADLKASNISQVAELESFKKERDFFKALLDDENTEKDFLKYYEIRQQEYIDKLNQFPKIFKYRQINYDIFQAAQPHEITKNGISEIQHFDQNLYNVKVEALGNGPDVFVTNLQNDLPSAVDPNLKCEWNNQIKQVLMYRTDGHINQSGDFGYCKYTIILKADGSVKSQGVLQGTFTNINPIAVNDEYVLDWGTEQKVSLDLLKNDHDDGDGKADAPFYPKDKSKFYVNPEGISAPIKIGKIDSNLVFEAQHEAPCPDESGVICYGGEITVKPKNSFNKFNFSFNYQVFDADGGISNEATVRLISTATTSEDSRDGSSGGGSFGIAGLFALLGLALWRRK